MLTHLHDSELKNNTTTEICVSENAHLGILTLNRPKALNALNLSMIKTMKKQLVAWEADPNIHAIIVQSQNSKAFCAGGDVRGLYDKRGNLEEQLSFFWQEYQLNYGIHALKKPYIALMDGITMGGGVGISLHGSHPVVTERFSFAMPETSIGFFPDIGASYLLSRCPNFQGIYLGLTGERLDAREARAIDLVKYCIRAEQLTDLIAKLEMLDLRTDAHTKVDRCLEAFVLSTNEENTVLEQCRERFEGSFNADDNIQNNSKAAWIETCFSQATVEGIIEALTQSSHAQNVLESTWAKKILITLERKSPLSLKITLEQLRRARSMSFADCLNMDYCLVKHFMQASDFYEGVRALLVDKDKSPKWKPNALEMIGKEEVEFYFLSSEDYENKNHGRDPIPIVAS